MRAEGMKQGRKGTSLGVGRRLGRATMRTMDNGTKYNGDLEEPTWRKPNTLCIILGVYKRRMEMGISDKERALLLQRAQVLLGSVKKLPRVQ